MKKKANKDEVVAKRQKINPYLDRFIHIIGYTLVLITVSVVFDDTEIPFILPNRVIFHTV